MARWRKFVAALVWLYPAALVLSAFALRFIGERWWITGVTLYLPRVAFMAPLPVLLLLTFTVKKREPLWLALGFASLLLLVITGFVLPWPHFRTANAPSMRVLSYNVNSGAGHEDDIMNEIEGYSPDIVVLQEIGPPDAISSRLRRRYSTVDASNQFLFATNYPVVSTFTPGGFLDEGQMHSPRYVEHTVDTPLGRIAVYDVHPISPRPAFYEMRGSGPKRAFFLHRMFTSVPNAIFEGNSWLRTLEIRALTEATRKETDPVVIAGDTNLPGLSYILNHELSDYRDGFASSSWGFGYTFPSKPHAWMRIDRVLASSQLRFVRFTIGTESISDHHCVVAELQRDSP